MMQSHAREIRLEQRNLFDFPPRCTIWFGEHDSQLADRPPSSKVSCFLRRLMVIDFNGVRHCVCRPPAHSGKDVVGNFSSFSKLRRLVVSLTDQILAPPPQG